MTLSLNQSTELWDRTLPRPSALLQQSASDIRSARTNSLVQHHINGRRSTVACIPPTSIPEQNVNHAEFGGLVTANLDAYGHTSRKRTSSAMSTEDSSRSSSPTSTSPIEGANGFCLCQKEPKIPRPRNAFILYRQHHHAAVVAQNPGLPNPDISKIIGEQWRQLSDKAKEEWKALAEDEKARHSQQYPDYRYKPRRSVRIGGQSSTSGLSLSNSDTIGHCQKCGGKPVSAPHTPHTPVTPGACNMPQMNARMPGVQQQIVSPPHSSHMRQYTDAYGRPIAPLYDPRFQYAPVQQRPGQIVTGPEPKKRRFNGEPVYGSTRPMYGDQAYQRSPRGRTVSDAVVTGQLHRANMGPPARTGHPVHPVQMPPSRPQHHPQQHRRDLSLTLPPLKTPLSQQVPVSLSIAPQSQKSGVQAMIMSIPILNKVKILSQIAPLLAAPGPASPPREVRGAIIAVEGMDPTSVYNMTNTLAEQLEKEGKFAVRIFGGPDPYDILASSIRASNGEGEPLNVSNYLDIISQWHKISREMQDYITTKPRPEEASPDDVVMHNADYSLRQQFASDNVKDNSASGSKTPVSAVSPKTINQTAELSLKSPPPKVPSKTQSADRSGPTQSKPRIPASAIAQAQAEADAKSEPQSDSRSDSTTPRPSQAQIQATAKPHQPTSTSGPMIPIAIVPHYQLTTVDTSSIAMPITDAYSPHSHWQWLATLWRGCIGPDVTIIIQAGDHVSDDSEHSANNTNNTSAQHGINAPHPIAGSSPAVQKQASSSAAAQNRQDVEIRLMDCRAVVVRAPKGKIEWDASEWWEKVKRRVGFEVEEFLRK